METAWILLATQLVSGNMFSHLIASCRTQAAPNAIFLLISFRIHCSRFVYFSIFYLAWPWNVATCDGSQTGLCTLKVIMMLRPDPPTLPPVSSPDPLHHGVGAEGLGTRLLPPPTSLNLSKPHGNSEQVTTPPQYKSVKYINPAETTVHS